MSKIQEKPSSLKKRTSGSTSKHEISYFFYFYVSFFALLYPDSELIRIHRPGWIRILSGSETLLFLHNWLDAGAREPAWIWGAGGGGYGGLPLRPPPGWLLAPGSLPAPPAGVLQVSGLFQHLQLGCFRYLVSASTSSWGACLCVHLQLGRLGIWSLPAPTAGML